MTTHFDNKEIIPNTNARPLYKITETIWYLLYIIEVVLFFRFILKLFGANSSAPFTNFVYTLSQPLVFPFAGVMGSQYLDQYLFAWDTILALIVYSFLAWILVRLLLLTRPITHKEAEEKLEDQTLE